MPVRLPFAPIAGITQSNRGLCVKFGDWLQSCTLRFCGDVANLSLSVLQLPRRSSRRSSKDYHEYTDADSYKDWSDNEVDYIDPQEEAALVITLASFICSLALLRSHRHLCKCELFLCQAWGSNKQLLHCSALAQHQIFFVKLIY